MATSKRFSRSRRRALAALAAVLFIALVATGMQAYTAARRAQRSLQAAAALLGGVAQPSSAPVAEKIAALTQAEQDAGRAGGALGSWPLGVAARVPVFGRSIRLAQAIAAGAGAMAHMSIPMVSAAAQMRSSGVNATALTQASNATAAFAQASQQAIAAVRAQQAFLVGAVPRAQFLAAATGAESTATKLADGMRVAAGFWGPTNSNRYLVLLQNPAELRGTGGLIGEYGVIAASPQGPSLVSLAPYRVLNSALGTGFPTPSSLAAYRNFGVGRDVTDVNIPPDFPAVARLLSAMYRRATGVAVQGVVAVDPQALGDILQVTGPIKVGGTELTGSSAAPVLLRRSYVQFASNNPARHAFLRGVAASTFRALRMGAQRHPLALAQALATAGSGRHLQFYLASTAGEQLVTTLGLSGSTVAPTIGDELAVYGVNTAGNKLDAYLQRTITDHIQLSSDGTSTSSISVQLQTQVPSGLPRYVVGPFAPGMQPAVDKENLSMLLPPGSAYTSVTVNGQSAAATTASAFGGTVVTNPLSLLSGLGATVRYEVVHPNAVQTDGRGLSYGLTIFPQATASPDKVAVAVQPPRGWHFASLPPGFINSGGSAHWSGTSASEQVTFGIAP